LHTGSHAELTQLSVPFASGGHVFVQLPQWFGSSVRLKHAPLHTEYGEVHVAATQLAPEHS
jgi:hypothetical protein